MIFFFFFFVNREGVIHIDLLFRQLLSFMIIALWNAMHDIYHFASNKASGTPEHKTNRHPKVHHTIKHNQA